MSFGFAFMCTLTGTLSLICFVSYKYHEHDFTMHGLRHYTMTVKRI